ncbi:MAG: DUF2726 domain-containing protein [Pseudomonadota bacterium]
MRDILSIVFTINFFLGALAGALFVTIRNGIKKFRYRRWRKANERRREENKRWRDEQDTKNPENQKKFIDAVDLRPQRLLNGAEYYVFKPIEEHLKNKPGYVRVMAQVNLGEFIEIKKKGRGGNQQKKKAGESFNSKRVDMLIIDSGGWPKIAIEYQGSGHNKGDAKQRDIIKKMCYEKADIHFLEIKKELNTNNKAHVDSIKKTIDDLLLTSTFKHVVLPQR